MFFTKFLFKQIDYFGYLPQNTYHDKNAVKIASNQVYNTEDAKHCTLDLICQKKSLQQKQAVFVNLHGGGFVAGDKKYRKSFAEYVTKHNVKVLNVNYGLAPDCNLLQIINELSAIFEWIKNYAESYGLDENKIILCGDSAGSYLALCLCALSINNEYAKAINATKIDTKIAGLILFSGIYYPTDSLASNMIFGVNHSLWEFLCGEKFVSTDSCKMHPLYSIIDIGNFLTKDFPPVFITHSDKDIFCKGNGQKLVEKLKSMQIPYHEVHSTSNMHDWQENMFTKASKLTLAEFDNFMADLLSNKITTENNRSITICRGKII